MKKGPLFYRDPVFVNIQDTYTRFFMASLYLNGLINRLVGKRILTKILEMQNTSENIYLSIKTRLNNRWHIIKSTTYYAL